jgi:hypothetical protein
MAGHVIIGEELINNRWLSAITYKSEDIMKRLLAAILVLSSVMSYAGMTCIPNNIANEGVLIFGSGGLKNYVKSEEDCKKAISKSKNGFACIYNNIARDGALLVSEEGHKNYVNTMEKCQEAVDNSKNGLVCVPNNIANEGALLLGRGFQQASKSNIPQKNYVDTMENCLKAISESK